MYKPLYLTALYHCPQAEYQRKMAQKQFEDQEREIQAYQKQMVRLEGLGPGCLMFEDFVAPICCPTALSSPRVP